MSYPEYKTTSDMMEHTPRAHYILVEYSAH